MRADLIDPDLKASILRSNGNVILSWYGSNAISYQVESSPTLVGWTNASPALLGSGELLSVTNPLSGQAVAFFRVKRLPPQVITAQFNPSTGILTITGDNQDNVIVVSRNAAGTLLVNGGAVLVTGGTPTVANTTAIQIFGQDGNDQLSLNEANGALPAAYLFGEGGNDTLTGGSGADTINGGPGADTLFGKGGADTLIGGDDDDVITGGDANDVIQMGSGNDRAIWNPGDDTDVIDGGDGVDTVEVNGGNGAETFTLTANGTRVRFDRLDPAPFSLDIGTCENFALNANGGNDSFSCTGNLAALIKVTVDGGAGDDTLLGSNGADVILGGDNNDFIDGQQGNDVVFGGAGDDTFQWDPGDGNDTIEGMEGNDTMVFNTANIGEMITLSAVGNRLRLTRDIASIVMDIAGVETVRWNAVGGADTITVNDLSGTEVASIEARLSGVIGGNTGDGAADSVIVHGTEGADNFTVTQAGSDLSIVGLSAVVSVFTGETNDLVTIYGHGGDDTINASGMTSLFSLTIDGGPGKDTITGGSLADVLIGGEDDDTITGRAGNDVVFGGAGNDTFIWNPGDGSDVLEGQAGADTLRFNGANINENIDASANGSRLRLFRDVGSVILDCNEVENVQVNAIGGADTITVNELTATQVTNVVVDLSFGGAGDGQPDTVVINGSQTNDLVQISGSASNAVITGLSAAITVTGSEPALDALIFNALGGADTVDASTLGTDVARLTLNGGLGADFLIGSQGGDLFNGGDGDDVVFGGGGDDTLVWNPGDDNDTFEGQAGTDTLQFNGANIAETFDISPNGGRVRFTRNIATVVMDCNDVETIRVEALGGADIATVNNLAGTDVTQVYFNLASTIGGNIGDAQADSITVFGTSLNDNVAVSGVPGLVTVQGLAATVTIAGSESALDRLTVSTLAGADVVNAAALPAGIIQLTEDGGDNDDTLTGSAGADILLGGAGDDVLIGGPGVDTLDGGTGSNVLIQD